MKFNGIFAGPLGQRLIEKIKHLFYSRRGEPISYNGHHLRYLVGTRPIRLSYLDAPDETTRNDARQLKFFLDNVQPGQIVLDIGGHKGQYAVLFSSLVGKTGTVVSFEPDPTAREILHVNLGLNSFTSNVRIETLALSDSSGAHKFYSLGGDSMSSLVRSGLGSNASAPGVTEHTVATMRLDDYLTANGIAYPHWIKLDTEGAEINILRGARKVLESGAIILCELHPYVWEEFGTTFEELLEIVSVSGRKIGYLDDKISIENGPVYGAVIIS